jgi:hypothetical protein
MGLGSSFPGGKAAGAWVWPLGCLVPSWKLECYTSTSHTSSWRHVELIKHRENRTLLFFIQIVRNIPSDKGMPISMRGLVNAYVATLQRDEGIRMELYLQPIEPSADVMSQEGESSKLYHRHSWIRRHLRGGLISLWLNKENNKLRDWKENVFTLHIPPWDPHIYDFVVLTSLTHPRKFILAVLQIRK